MAKVSKERRTAVKKTQHHRFVAKSTAFTVMLSLSGVIGFMGLSSVKSQAGSYTYTKIAALGETAPGGAQYFFDFEPGQINNRGDVIYVADLSTDGVNDIGEGVFLRSHGQISALALPGLPAPGGGAFAFALSPTGVNDEGDAAAAMLLNPFTLPVGLNGGLYRYSAAKKSLSAVVVPLVTVAPGSGTFQGVSFETSINNPGDICFAAIIPTTAGIVPAQGLGMGIFVANKPGRISSVVMPGDSAPGGGRFDFAEVAWINARGDVAFGAHIAGEECVGFNPPTLENQSGRIFCGDNVYLRKAPSGQIISIAHQGDAAPGGGVFRHAWGPIVNDNGQILFVGDLTVAPPDNPNLFDVSQGLYLFNGSLTVPVVRPGDALPDGTMKTVSDSVNGHHLNNRGEISFLAALNTGDLEAIYVKSGNAFRLVAKSGTSIPGVGTIDNFDTAGSPLFGGAVNNDRGQVIFSANLVGGGAALIVATPTP